MKSIRIKLSAYIIPLLLLSGSAGYVSGLFTPLWLKILVPVVLFLLSLLILQILLKISVLRPLFQMKREIDGEESIMEKRADEFGELSRRLKSKITGIEEREMEVRDSLVREITESENDKYLLNINEGLLFIDYGQIISDFHSRALKDIIDRSEIGGQHLSDFLYPDKEGDHDKRKELEKFILGLFHEPELIDQLNEESNPLHNIWISRDDERRILLDGSFCKVEDKGELVQLMIIFRDRTDEGILEKKLDESGMRSDFELDSIIAILRAGPGPFLQFIEESDTILEEFREGIISLEEEDVILRSMRKINSMKCSAVYFDFRAVEKLCHNLEDILSDFRKGNFTRKEALDIIVDDIYAQFDHVKHLIERFREFLSSDQGRVYETHRNEQEHFFDTLKIMMTRHADELEKEIDFLFSSDFDNYDLIGEVKNPVIHLLRNAVDHGIELPADREAGGKERTGRISLTVSRAEEGGAKIIVEDDGAGIDFDRLRKIAVQKGFIKKEESPGQANLIRTLFKSGFSSRDEMKGLSGRGVGLDAVKEEISRLGGKISIKTEWLKGSRFTMQLPPE